MTPFADGPGSPYKAIVDGIWPQLGDEDPRQYAWDVAYREVTTRTIAHRATPDGPLELLTSADPDPLRGQDVRPLLRVTCAAELHNRSRPPTLAEVWQTSPGLLFVAKLPGRLLDPGLGQNGEDPFDPPAAVMNPRRVAPRSPRSGAVDAAWEHVPITIVRLLLEDDVPARLWVKCVHHGPAHLDRGKLYREYALHHASPGSDTREPRYVRLDSVAALSSG